MNNLFLIQRFFNKSKNLITLSTNNIDQKVFVLLLMSLGVVTLVMLHISFFYILLYCYLFTSLIILLCRNKIIGGVFYIRASNM